MRWQLESAGGNLWLLNFFANSVAAPSPGLCAISSFQQRQEPVIDRSELASVFSPSDKQICLRNRFHYKHLHIRILIIPNIPFDILRHCVETFHYFLDTAWSDTAGCDIENSRFERVGCSQKSVKTTATAQLSTWVQSRSCCDTLSSLRSKSSAPSLSVVWKKMNVKQSTGTLRHSLQATPIRPTPYRCCGPAFRGIREDNGDWPYPKPSDFRMRRRRSMTTVSPNHVPLAVR